MVHVMKNASILFEPHKHCEHAAFRCVLLLSIRAMLHSQRRSGVLNAHTRVDSSEK